MEGGSAICRLGRLVAHLFPCLGGSWCSDGRTVGVRYGGFWIAWAALTDAVRSAGFQREVLLI